MKNKNNHKLKFKYLITN